MSRAEKAEPRVGIKLDGRPIDARPGVSVAAVLIENGLWNIQSNPVTDEERGPYCGMGVCLECEVTVDGAPHRRACLERVRHGMSVDTGRRNEGGGVTHGS